MTSEKFDPKFDYVYFLDDEDYRHHKVPLLVAVGIYRHGRGLRNLHQNILCLSLTRWRRSWIFEGSLPEWLGNKGW